MLESAALLVGVVALLFVVVFPWLEPRLPFTDVTVDEGGEGADIVDTDNPDPSVTTPATEPAPDGGSPVLGAGSPDALRGVLGSGVVAVAS
jgi:hypothetical protein